MAGSPTATPTASKTQRRFGDVLITALLAGQSARRLSWPDGDQIFMQGGFLHIYIADSIGDRIAGGHKLLVSEGDLAADDWVIL
jgi:hypothetical protein